MNYTEENISTIVTRDFRASDIFRKHGIDFCCGGMQSLRQVCKDKNIDAEQIIAELKQLEFSRNGTEMVYDTWEIDFLADFILNTHHRFAKSELPVLQSLLTQLCHAHGHHHHELFEVKQLLDASAAALMKHMEKEEVILFPYIKELLAFRNHPLQHEYPVIEPSDNPLNEMMEEHVTEGERFREMARLTHQYEVPADGCNTYLVAMKKLETFEKDLHRHIHLENNILFPKTLALESFIAQHYRHKNESFINPS